MFFSSLTPKESNTVFDPKGQTTVRRVIQMCKIGYIVCNIDQWDRPIPTHNLGSRISFPFGKWVENKQGLDLSFTVFPKFEDALPYYDRVHYGLHKFVIVLCHYVGKHDQLGIAGGIIAHKILSLREVYVRGKDFRER